MSRGNIFSDPRDANRVPVDMGVSSADGHTPIPIEINPNSGRVLVDAAITSGELSTVSVSNLGDKTIFGETSTASFIEDISVLFDDMVSPAKVTTTATSGGTAVSTGGQLVMSTGTNSAGAIVVQSISKILYFPGREARATFTRGFSTPTVNTEQWHGVYDGTDGFKFGYDGTTFEIVRLNGGTPDVITTFNGDPLDGSSLSQFTSGGTPVAIDRTKGNNWRIRFGWHGFAQVIFEVLSPDGGWITWHTIIWSNANTAPHVQHPELPVRAEVKNKGNTTNIQGFSGSWTGGIMSVSKAQNISVDNFTNTPLTAGSAYTGSFDNTKGYVSAIIYIVADQVSAGNGIEFQYSHDGVTQTGSSVTKTYSATDVTNGFVIFAIPLPLDYFRIKYTNGGVNQGTFFISVQYNNTPIQTPIGVISNSMNDSSLATMVRNVPAGKNITGSYNNATITQTDGSGRVGQHVGVMKFDVPAPILALTSWVTGQATIASTTVAVNVIPSPSTGRKTFAVKSLSSNTKTVFIGPTSAVSTGNGWELAAGESFIVEVDPTTGVWVIGSTSTSQTLCFAEVI